MSLSQPATFSYSVSISNPITIEETLFTAWHNGIPENMLPIVSEGPSDSVMMLIYSQYHLFASMEPYLQRPRYFIDQLSFPLPLPLKRHLIEQYFGLEGTFEGETEVVRELIDKKMIAKSRSYLDDISARNKVSLASCRRQVNHSIA